MVDFPRQDQYMYMYVHLYTHIVYVRKSSCRVVCVYWYRGIQGHRGEMGLMEVTE